MYDQKMFLIELMRAGQTVPLQEMVTDWPAGIDNLTFFWILTRKRLELGGLCIE